VSKFNEVIQLESNLIELKKALLHSQRAEAKAKFKTANLIEAVYEAAANSLLSTPRPKIIPPLKDSRKGKPEVALVHLTDWQAGKKTVSYDIPALSSRIEEMIKKVLSLTEIQRAHHPVRECVVMLGGDMVEGVSIFPGQQYEIGAHLYEQMFEVVRIIEGAIRSLAQSFEKVTVVCEFGNHGRLGKKGDMPAGDNIDRMAYQIAANNCKDIKHVKWQMSDDWYQIFHIGNYKVLLVHGDEIGSFGNILRKVSAWSTGVVEPFDDCYMGHFHTPTALTMANGGRIFVTGSPESNNEYARTFIAAVGKPSQRIHFIDPDKGRVTAEYVCWL
jgi:predicted phosphodiesterase